jgi:hypothetical protein
MSFRFLPTRLVAGGKPVWGFCAEGKTGPNPRPACSTFPCPDRSCPSKVPPPCATTLCGVACIMAHISNVLKFCTIRHSCKHARAQRRVLCRTALSAHRGVGCRGRCGHSHVRHGLGDPIAVGLTHFVIDSQQLIHCLHHCPVRHVYMIERAAVEAVRASERASDDGRTTKDKK